MEMIFALISYLVRQDIKKMILIRELLFH